jgi:hypothetical protein
MLAQTLHGVDPAVSRRAWGLGLDPKDVGFNSWGQRDRERTVHPAAGTYRVAFIGDSFLEESTLPVSLAVEGLLACPDCEIINLGVSASQADEYYYRLRYVALPLGCRHCVVWIFSGNDFVDEPRTLPSDWGFCAVSPRPSLLTLMGCRSLNHVLTNNRRPVILAWFTAGGLAAQESALHARLRRASDAELRQMLLNSIAHSDRSYRNLKGRLDSPEISRFFEMLRSPDAGKFRSYYLTSGVWSAAAGGGQWDPNPETQALYWVEEMRKCCEERGVKLTVVVIPEAFQVDRRMRDMWSPLTDMRHLTQPCRQAAERFCAAARALGIDALDLHSAFEEVPGTYLNLDGHWSQTGVELAARTVVEHLRTQLAGRE